MKQTDSPVSFDIRKFGGSTRRGAALGGASKCHGALRVFVAFAGVSKIGSMEVRSKQRPVRNIQGKRSLAICQVEGWLILCKKMQAES